MKNKVFLASIAAAMAIPAVVVPVQAQGVQETEVFKGFSDVPKTHPYYDIIMEMQGEGIIKGYEDNTFRPSQAISRMHVASLLDRAVELEPIRDAVDFKDVPKTHAYYEIIQKLQRAGIVDGSNGNYSPNASLTRVQMAKILVNAFDLKVKAEYDFPDVPTSHWGSEYVRALYSNGITLGDNGYFKPNEPVSRAHYAVFLHRLLNIDEDFVAPPIPQPKPDPKPDPKPEPKPDPKPDPKPEPPKGDGSIIEDKDISVPKGWTMDKVKAHDEKTMDVVVKNGLNAGTGKPFGTSRHVLREVRTAEDQAGIVGELKAIGSSETINDWIAGLNYAIKTGELYIASDNSYSLYVTYHPVGNGEIIVGINFTK